VEIQIGYCHCGCGEKARFVRGKFNRYIYGHYSDKGKRGADTNSFKTGKYISQGKVYVRMMDHPDAINGGYVLEHRLVAEQALGKPLPRGSVVHHIDGDSTNNVPSNFVLCENQAYHNLLHQRALALAECGHANWRKCAFCHEYDDPQNMVSYKGQRNAYHRKCKNDYDRSWRNYRGAMQCLAK